MMEATDLIVMANTLVDSKHTSGASKEKLYKWLAKDKPGTFMMINKNELYVDHSYQREKINTNRINNILSEFSWAAFGVISVSKRDGKLMVFDGQHRALAAMKMDSIIKIPCMVFDTETHSEEARTFLDANSNRSAVNAVTKYKAGLVAMNDICLSIKSAADDFGYKITENASKPFDISCIGTLMYCESRFKKGSVRHILKNSTNLASQGVLSNNVIRGLNYLRSSIENGLENKVFQTRIKTITLAALASFMHNESLVVGDTSPRTMANGILKAVNANHRQKIRMVKHEDGE